MLMLLGTGPTLGCCVLMLLLVFGDLLVSCADVELHVENLQEVWDGHRLLTHLLCVPDKQFLVISLLLFPLLHWRQEQLVGTLHYLHLSYICTLCNAAIYILGSLILPFPVTASSGFIATQLSLLIAQGPRPSWRHSKKITCLMSCGIITAVQYLCPQSALFYHFCGIITGLTIRAGLLNYLQLSEARIRALDRMCLCRCLATFPIACFIPSQDKGSHNLSLRAQDRLPFSYTDVQESHAFANMPPAGVSTQDTSIAHFQVSPVWYRDAEALEEEMLEAGILASLGDFKQHEIQRPELTINKSSVSALRLQQLERMGFPTVPAVVALAATGKVEGAVSLLVEGQVGENITVKTDSLWTARPT